jgi:hypothetical protein
MMVEDEFGCLKSLWSSREMVFEAEVLRLDLALLMQLDNFTALVRDNPYVRDPGYSSMDHAIDQAKRLRNTVVRLGDVRPGDEVGHVAIAASETNGLVVGQQDAKRLYG